MFQYIDVVQDKAGNALYNASVQVLTYPGGTPATIYSDFAGTMPIVGSTVYTDLTGSYNFFLSDQVISLYIVYQNEVFREINAITISSGGSSSNLSGGSANQIPYQTAPSTTSFITAPTIANTVLAWTGSTFSWIGAVLTSVANAFTNQQAVTPYRANINGAVSINLAATAKSNNLHLTLTGNVSSFALTNPVDGAIYNIRFIQDGTGSRTMPSLPGVFKFPGGAVPTFSTSPGAVDFMSCEYGSVEATYMCGFVQNLM